MHTHLTSNVDIEYLDERVAMNELMLPLWKSKIEMDKQIIHDIFSVPIAVKYCTYEIISVNENG